MHVLPVYGAGGSIFKSFIFLCGLFSCRPLTTFSLSLTSVQHVWKGAPGIILVQKLFGITQISPKTRAPALRHYVRGQLRRLPVYDLVHGTVLLIAKRLCDASELKKDDPDQVSTPYAIVHFNKATSLSRK